MSDNISSIVKQHELLRTLKKDNPIMDSFSTDLEAAYQRGREYVFNYGSSIPGSAFIGMSHKDRDIIINLAHNSQAARKAVYVILLLGALELGIESKANLKKRKIFGVEIQQQLLKALLWLPPKERAILLGFSKSASWKIIRTGAIAVEKVVLTFWGCNGKVYLPYITEDIINKVDLICTFNNFPAIFKVQVKGQRYKSETICEIFLVYERKNIKVWRMNVKVGLAGIDYNSVEPYCHISKKIIDELRKINSCV